MKIINFGFRMTLLEFLKQNDLLLSTVNTAVISIVSNIDSSFFLSTNFKKKFKDGIFEVAKITNALFITGKLFLEKNFKRNWIFFLKFLKQDKQQFAFKLTGEAIRGSKSKLLGIFDSDQSIEQKVFSKYWFI